MAGKLRHGAGSAAAQRSVAAAAWQQQHGSSSRALQCAPLVGGVCSGRSLSFLNSAAVMPCGTTAAAACSVHHIKQLLAEHAATAAQAAAEQQHGYSTGAQVGCSDNSSSGRDKHSSPQGAGS